MTRIIVAGAGKRGVRHLEAYRKIPGASVVGIVEPDAQRRLDAIGLAGDEAEAFGSVPDALDATDADVVDVCTPTAHHFEDEAAVLDAGKSVFCEKPLVPTLAEAEALHERVEAGKGSLRVGYVYRYHPRIQQLKDRLDAGVLGNAYLAMLRIGGRGSHRLWKHQAGMAGGALLDMATHMLDLAYWLFGGFTEIEILHQAVLVHKREIDGVLHDVDADDLVIVRLRTVGDVEVLVHADFVTPGFANLIEVAGTNGSASTSIVTAIPDRLTLVRPAGDLPAGETTTPGESADMLQAQLASFVDDVVNGRLVSDMRASLEIARVLEKAASR